MFKYLAAGAVLALVSTAAMAQNAPPQPTLDQQVEQAQSKLNAAQAEFYLQLARKFQAEAAAGATHAAAVDAWWASWWKGTHPETPPPTAAVAPEKPAGK